VVEVWGGGNGHHVRCGVRLMLPQRLLPQLHRRCRVSAEMKCYCSVIKASFVIAPK